MAHPLTTNTSRVLRNREAAKLFRQRQRDQLEDLEAEVIALKAEHKAYTEQKEQLTAENAAIQQQVQFVHSFITEALKYAFQSGLPNIMMQNMNMNTQMANNNAHPSN